MTEPLDAGVVTTGPEPLRQALVIHPDGGAEFTFLARPAGEPITGVHRGVRWTAYVVDGPSGENAAATSFARSMGWPGDVALFGTLVFVGDDVVGDVPGVLIAEAVRLWGEVPFN